MPEQKLNPITVTCPNCQSPPGEFCTQPTENGRRTVKWFHLARDFRVEFPTEEQAQT